MRKPWFQIVEIVSPGRKTLPQIAREVSAQHRVGVREMCGESMMPHVVAARADFIAAAKRDRPELASWQVAGFLNRDSSCVRHTWRKMRRAAA